VIQALQVLAHILKIICPILAIRATYELISDILTSLPSLFFVINLGAFGLADVIIAGTTYFLVIYVALGLGLLPKLDEEKQKNVQQ
jgi:hypothetical protein